MSVLHAWAIPLGIAAALLPVAIHFLTRPRPTSVPWSTLRFVRQAIQQRRSRWRLRDALVLALRTLAVLLLAWAMARPLVGDRPESSAADASAVRIVMLDVSQSMAAVDRSVRAIERARAAAAEQFGFRPGLKANLILAGARPHAVLDRPSTNFGAMEEELARCQPRAERLNLPAAMELAGAMLAAAPADAQREFIIVSDFQRSNWAAADFSPLPSGTKIMLESVAPTVPPANLAVVHAGRSARADSESTLEIEVGNYSPIRQKVQVEIDLGENTFRLEGECPAGARTTLTHPLAHELPGWRTGTVRRLGPADALEADDSRPLVVEVRRASRYGLVTRQPARQRPSSSYFIERALAPAPVEPPSLATSESQPSVVRIDPQQLDLDALAPVDLLVLDHPGKLSRESLGLIASLVRRGKNLLYVASEPVDASNLAVLAEAAGSDWQLAVQFVPRSSSQARTPLALSEVRRSERPFSAFGDELSALLAPVRLTAGLATRAAPAGLADSVLATYSDRSACLAVGSWGAGQFAVWNVDLQASNLPTSPLFVPLVQELVGRLLAPRADKAESASGEPTAVYLPAEAGDDAGLQVSGPRAGSAAGTLTDETSAVLWRLDADAGPGVYRVQRDGLTVFALARALPAEESDLRSLGADVFQQRLAGGRDVRFRQMSSPGDTRDDAWLWLLVGCIGCMLCEWVVLRTFRT